MNISKKFSFTVSSTLSYLIFGVLLYYLQRTGQKRAGSSGSIRQPCLVLAQPLIFPLLQWSRTVALLTSYFSATSEQESSFEKSCSL